MNASTKIAPRPIRKGRAVNSRGDSRGPARTASFDRPDSVNHTMCLTRLHVCYDPLSLAPLFPSLDIGVQQPCLTGGSSSCGVESLRDSSRTATTLQWWPASATSAGSTVARRSVKGTYLSYDMLTHAHAPKSSTNFILYPFVISECSTDCLGHGHGYDCHSSVSLIHDLSMTCSCGIAY